MYAKNSPITLTNVGIKYKHTIETNKHKILYPDLRAGFFTYLALKTKDHIQIVIHTINAIKLKIAQIGIQFIIIT